MLLTLAPPAQPAAGNSDTAKGRQTVSRDYAKPL